MHMPGFLQILCFSDLHLDLAAARRVAAKAPVGNIDLLVSAGDLGLDGVHDPDLYRMLAKSGVPVLAIPGNHDGDEPYERSITASGSTSIDSMVHRHGDFFIAGHGIRSNPDCGERESEKFLTFAASIEQLPAGRLVLVSHLPPRGSLSARDRHFVDRGSPALADWIRRRQPVAVICGHVHHREPVMEHVGGTLVVNPGPYGWLQRLRCSGR